MGPQAVVLTWSITSTKLYITCFMWYSGLVSRFVFTGLSHQQVAVRQRHPTLQTDGGEVRIWQPVATLTPGIKHILEESGGREGRKERRRPRTICQRQTEGRLSLPGFHAWMVWEQTAALTTVCCTLNPAGYTADVLKLSLTRFFCNKYACFISLISLI